MHGHQICKYILFFARSCHCFLTFRKYDKIRKGLWVIAYISSHQWCILLPIQSLIHSGLAGRRQCSYVNCYAWHLYCETGGTLCMLTMARSLNLQNPMNKKWVETLKITRVQLEKFWNHKEHVIYNEKLNGQEQRKMSKTLWNI